MKKFISGIIVGMILMCTIPTLAKTDTVQAIYSNIKVAINGENVTFAKGEEPVTINNRTYVSAKYVAEALGATVKWDGKNSTVVIDSRGTTAAKTDSLNSTSEEASNITNTELKDYTVPEIDESDKYLNPTRLFDGDFEFTTYNGYKALVYNENTYINASELSNKTKITAKFDGKNNTIKLYKDEKMILETLDANPINYVHYDGCIYFSINFLGEYLED